MSTPEAFNVGPSQGPGSQPVYPVNEWGPDVVHGTVSELGTPAHVVSEWSPGVRAVMFDGPVPGTAEHMHMMAMTAQPLGGPPPYDPTPDHLLLLLH